MLSVASLKTGQHRYYVELVSLNYYTEGGEPPGLWAGSAAREFGLEPGSRVDARHLERLCAGFDPHTGEALVQNAGKKPGECRAPRKQGDDCTLSMPKGASIVWACADDGLRRAIDKMALKAAHRVLEFLEDHCGLCRVGKGGKSYESVPLLAAIFPQSTSRQSDPQHHLHMLLINLTRKADGTARAFDSTHVYHYKMAAGALYRAALAEGFRALGFEIERSEKGGHVFFDIKGIPEELKEFFSKRRAEMEAAAERRYGSAHAARGEDMAALNKQTRKAKLERPSQELFEEWRAQAREYGITAEAIERLRQPARKLTLAEREDLKEKVFQDAVSRLEASHAHWDRADLTMTVCQEAQGRVGDREALEIIERKLAGRELIHLGGLTTKEKSEHKKQYVERVEERYTTQAVWQAEEVLLEAVDRLKGRTRPVDLRHVEAAIASRPTIKPEQAQAVRYLCDGPDIRAMTGNAGTGKSFTLNAVREVFEAQGRKVIGCALSGDAAELLQKESGIASDNLKRTLYRLDKGYIRLDRNSVIVLDEAGTVGTLMMSQLLKHAVQAGAKVLLVGDAKQLQPIDAGGPFKSVCARIGDVLLKKIFRQAEPWRREAVEHAAYGRAREALAAFLKRGDLHAQPTKGEVLDRMVERWLVLGGAIRPEAVLMVADLNSDLRVLNRKCQAVRIEAGLVDPSKSVYANQELFHVGDRLQFTKLDRKRGIQNSNTGKITAIDEENQALTVQLDKDGRSVTVSAAEFGDHIRLAYGSTTFKSQGKTVENALVLLGGHMTDRHSVYVGASRAKFKTELFVDADRAGPELRDIIKAASLDRAKDLAHDIAERQQREHEQERRHDRGLSLGR